MYRSCRGRLHLVGEGAMYRSCRGRLWVGGTRWRGKKVKMVKSHVRRGVRQFAHFNLSHASADV